MRAAATLTIVLLAAILLTLASGFGIALLQGDRFGSCEGLRDAGGTPERCTVVHVLGVRMHREEPLTLAEREALLVEDAAQSRLEAERVNTRELHRKEVEGGAAALLKGLSP
jgi:hypothetical protein